MLGESDCSMFFFVSHDISVFFVLLIIIFGSKYFSSRHADIWLSLFLGNLKVSQFF